jgi:hypothetical protein
MTPKESAYKKISELVKWFEILYFIPNGIYISSSRRDERLVETK